MTAKAATQAKVTIIPQDVAKMPAGVSGQATGDVGGGGGGLPAAQNGGGVPSSRLARMSADAGKGVSTDRDDKIIPMIRTLQAQSPQVLRQKNEYIDGALAGDFYFKGMLNEIVRGELGFSFQPCAFLKCWLEFDGPRDSKPNFVRRHEDYKKRPAYENDEGDLVAVPDLVLDEDGFDYINKDGHRFTLSREHYGLIDGKPFLLPFGGSGHATSKQWQTLMDQFKLPDGRVEPAFNHKYHVTTMPMSNKSGDWFGLRIRHMGLVSDDEYEMGLAFYDAVMGGGVKGEVDSGQAGGGAPGDAAADKHV